MTCTLFVKHMSYMKLHSTTSQSDSPHSFQLLLVAHRVIRKGVAQLTEAGETGDEVRYVYIGITCISYLCGVHFSLDDVENGDVAVIVPPIARGGYHHILWLYTNNRATSDNPNIILL